MMSIRSAAWNIGWGLGLGLLVACSVSDAARGEGDTEEVFDAQVAVDTGADSAEADTLVEPDAAADSSSPRDAEDALDTANDLASPVAEDPFARGVLTVRLSFDPLAKGIMAATPGQAVPVEVTLEPDAAFPARASLEVGEAGRDLSGKPTLVVKVEGPGAPPGLAGLRLDAMIDDPSHLRALLAHRVFERLGVPAPRTTYARVSIDGEPYGLYAATELAHGPAFLERAAGTPEGSVFATRASGDLWPWQVPELLLVSGAEDDRALLAALAADLERFRLARLDGAPIPLAEVLAGKVDLARFRDAMALELALGHWSGYARYAWDFALHVGPGGAVTFLPERLGQVLAADDLPDPWHGGGKLLMHCRDDPDCRAAFGRAIERVADALTDPALRAEASALRFVALAELADDPRREADDVAVRAAQDEVLELFATRPIWLRDNLACADPAAVDGDGDGHSGCDADCDDDDPAIHPGAPERCNLRDDDCDGVLDEAPRCPPCTFVPGPRPGSTWALCHAPLPWAEAAATCRAKGGALASIASASEHLAFTRLALGLQWTGWWIGLSDREVEGRFTWSDGEPLVYSRWSQGEPNDYGGREDCVQVTPWGDGLWNDLDCARSLPFVCAYP